MLTHLQESPGRVFATPLGRIAPRAAAACRTCHVREKAVCAALGGDELTALDAAKTRQSLKAGQAVYYEGDEAAAVHMVASGTVRLSNLLPDGRRQVTGFLTAGDFLGLMDDSFHACTAEAVDDVVLCRIDRAAFERLCQRFPRLEHRLRLHAADALAAVHAHLLLLGQRSPRERLACFLLRLSERKNASGSAEGELRLPMKRADIADFLGLTIETVSRTFTAMRREALIDLPQPQLVVFKDRDGLEEIAA